MTNLINSMLANNQTTTTQRPVAPKFVIDIDGQAKPLDNKGQLLPSKIFGSPITYAKDLKTDIVSIGKAAKGQANDHELGRINDVAMKAGSLALATYLFVKNPLKLSKTMEFVGFGSFFGAMALWPKLAIQAPLKAMTGVDIHQKYIDSQGRKKMLFQDPQYVLTNLYSREDLDKIGKKNNVSENAKDRDNVIKQKAQKIALQGNTLWMMTAGPATPIIGALTCSALESPIGEAIEKSTMAATEKALSDAVPVVDTFKEKLATVQSKAFTEFLDSKVGKKFNDIVNPVATKISEGVNSAEIINKTKATVEGLRPQSKLTFDALQDALKDVKGVDIASLSEAQINALRKAVDSNNLKEITRVLTTSIADKKAGKELGKKIFQAVGEVMPKSTEAVFGKNEAAKVGKLYGTMRAFVGEKKVLDDYIDARIGQKSGTFIANQWKRFSNGLLDSMSGRFKSFFNPKELKQFASADPDAILAGLDKIAGSENYEEVISKLMSQVNSYEERTGKTFMDMVSSKSGKIFQKASDTLARDGFTDLSKILNPKAGGNLRNALLVETEENVLGARASFYRLIQLLDLEKQLQTGSLQTRVQSELSSLGLDASPNAVSKMIKNCQKILLSATTTDHIEKFRSIGFDLSEGEFKAAMNILYNPKVESTFGKGVDASGFKAYLSQFAEKVVNWQNGMTPELKGRVVGATTGSLNGVERNGYVGQSVVNLVRDTAKNRLNSNKWLAIFGAAMVALTAATLTATYMINKSNKETTQK